MTYTYIVNPETGEILFDLVHDLITQNIRAIKLIAKKLNAVLRQKREKMGKEVTVKVTIENIDELKNLSKKLKEQVREVYKTLNEINEFEMFSKLSINQKDQ